mgnify:CR=1 FL=1
MSKIVDDFSICGWYTNSIGELGEKPCGRNPAGLSSGQNQMSKNVDDFSVCPWYTDTMRS